MVDHNRVVNHLTFTLRAGETLGLVGESGSGKSTTGLALLRLFSSGEMQFAGESIQGRNRRQDAPLRRRPFRWSFRIEFIPQPASERPADYRGRITRSPADVDVRATREQAVIQVMQEVGLDPLTRQRYPAEFSVASASVLPCQALIVKPQLIVLDEPTSSLDKTVQAQILALLKTLQQSISWPICLSATIYVLHGRSAIR